MNSLELVKAIEAELKKKKIKKSEFYEKTGISSATFSQWRNEIYAPSSANLKKIEEYLGIKFTIEQKEKSPAPEGAELNKDNYRVFLESLSFSDLAALNAEIAQLMVEKANSEQ